MRRFDNTSMAGGMDILTKLFSNNVPPVSIARKAGLRAVTKLPIAKRFFMKQLMGIQSGDSGVLPQLIKGNSAK